MSDDRIELEISTDRGSTWALTDVRSTSPVIAWLRNYGSPFDTGDEIFRWPACLVS